MLKFIPIFAVLIFSQNIFALSAPWQGIQEEPSTPWGSTERKQGRESFFKKLGSEEATDETTEAPVNSRSEAAAETSDGPANPGKTVFDDVQDQPAPGSTSNFSALPWTKFRQKFPGEKFSKRLIWPILHGKLTSGYGIRGGRFHEGLDISAPAGSQIRAVAPGRIVYVGFISGYGNTIVVYHGDGISSIYAHASLSLKERGTRVNQGETLALVGNSGHASGYHCHFEVRQDGQPINPLRYSFGQSPLVAVRDRSGVSQQ